MKARVTMLFYIDGIGLFVAFCKSDDGHLFFALCPPSIYVGDFVQLHKIDFYSCSKI